MPTAPWTDPSTHVYGTAEQVTGPTLNTFVEQNLVSLGNYTSGTHYFSGSIISGGATSKSAFVGPNLSIATFPEAFTMIVKAIGTVQPSSTQQVYLGVFDETGSGDITMPAGQGYFYTSGPASAYIPTTWGGKKQYAANGSAGFSLYYWLASGTASIWANIVEVTFVRGAV